METKNRRLTILLCRQRLIPFLLCFWFLVPQGLAGQHIIKMGHSHNDYLNEKPLINALNNNFKSIEVDVFLLNSKLYVGHNWIQLRKNRTLQSLYLDPLWAKYIENNGEIYNNGESLYLLVDIKTSAEKTYKTLKSILYQYKPMLTAVISDSLINRPVTIILSGNRPIIEKRSIQDRFVFIDGRYSDISKDEPNNIMPIISMSWLDHFTWRGDGEMKDEEALILKEIINVVHKENKLIRFWASPDNYNSWNALQSAGVDLINTDKIEQYSDYYNAKN